MMFVRLEAAIFMHEKSLEGRVAYEKTIVHWVLNREGCLLTLTLV